MSEQQAATMISLMEMLLRELATIGEELREIKKELRNYNC
jgi:hypothetical protein